MSNPSLFSRKLDPIYQALFTFGGVILIILLGKLADAAGVYEVSDRFPWMTAASLMLLFALFNAVFSAGTDNMARYYGRSVYSFMGLAAASGLMAWLFSGLTIGQAGSYRWIYIVVTIGYFVFLIMMFLMRQVVEFAQKEEWNHPRIRNKDR